MVQAIYVVSFLLSFLLLMLMTVMGVLYHRHHRGTFLVRCRSSSFGSTDRDDNNNDNQGSVNPNHPLHPGLLSGTDDVVWRASREWLNNFESINSLSLTVTWNMQYSL